MEKRMENIAEKIDQAKSEIADLVIKKATAMSEGHEQDLEAVQKEIKKAELALKAWTEAKQSIEKYLSKTLAKIDKDDARLPPTPGKVLENDPEGLTNDDLFDSWTPSRTDEPLGLKAKTGSSVKRLVRKISMKDDAVAKKVNWMPGSPMEPKGGTVDTMGTRNIKVPSSMPRFRGDKGIEDPFDFLEFFNRVMIAHEISEDRYMRLVPMCLDAIDRKWFDHWMENQVDMPTWREFQRDFIGHFRHPNASALWLEKIHQLRMDDGGVQRYSDTFVYLAERLGWSMDDEMTIYRYKAGLNQWILDQLSAAEATFIMAKQIDAKEDFTLSVEMLTKMALAVEANRGISKNDSRDRSGRSDRTNRSRIATEFDKTRATRMAEGRCFACGTKGHRIADCPNRSGKKEISEKIERKDAAMPKKIETKGYERKPTCYYCKEIGHYSNECPKKVVRVIGLQEVGKDGVKGIDSGCLQTPCTLNGKRLMGLVDAGATISFVDRKFAEESGWKIIPKKGKLRQAFDGSDRDRIGIIENLQLENGLRSIEATFEVADLSGNEKLILGMDLFPKLGFELRNVPFTWPTPKIEEKLLKKDEEDDEDVSDGNDESRNTGKGGTNEDSFEEWKEVLEANRQLPPSSICALEGSELAIETGNSKPVWIRQYPIPQALHKKVDVRIQEWIENEWIIEAPRDCRWNLPLLAAPKPPKEEGGEMDVRVCLDARALNNIITDVPDSHMPSLREVIDHLGEFKYISVLDLANSFHQFKLRKQDQVKTAFTWGGKQYMFQVVPFGLKIMTGHMQRVMEKLLKSENVNPFQDDVAIASKTREKHIQDVQRILEKITYEAKLKLQLKKCKFFRKEARVLGSIVSENGIRMDPMKVKAILGWPEPEDGKALQRFMGAVNFHREFSPNFARIAAPLESHRNTKGKIKWTPELRKAFDSVKQIFADDILLRMIDWTKTMYLTTDACLTGIGAWIGQKDENGVLQPVICASKKLTPTQQRWSATKRELWALMWAMNKFRHYLIGRWFIARVDHKPLVEMLKNRMTVMTEGWIDTILTFNFTTEYLPCQNNQLADALSRAESNGIEIRTVKVAEIDEKTKWEAERRGKEILLEKKRKDMIEKTHAMGHFGVESIFNKIMDEGYWWPKMRKDIRQEIQGCIKCLRFDIQEEGFHPARSIIAETPWDHLEIDLIGPLPSSTKGNCYILTIVDICTSYVVLRTLPSKDMEVVARKLWEVFCEYGTPRILQSDNGSEFVNRVIAVMTELYGIEQRLTTAYNPRANGLVERKNKEVSRSLKKFIEGAFGNWDDWMPLVQVSLNEAIGARTKSSAFSLMHGRKFNGFFDFSKTEMTDDIDRVMGQRERAWEEFREIVLPGILDRTKNVKTTQEKRLNDRKQIEPLKQGTKVMAIDNTRASKWDPKYEGPFEVVEQHQGGTYSLQDATGEKMPRRRTIDMLKPIIENLPMSETSRRGELDQGIQEKEGKPEKQETTKKTKRLRRKPGKTEKKEETKQVHLEIEKIVNHRMQNGIVEYYVKWKNYGDEENQWRKMKDFDGLGMIKKYWKEIERKGKEETEKERLEKRSKRRVSKKGKKI